MITRLSSAVPAMRCGALLLPALMLCATLAPVAGAQGTLSTQGFGYPVGGLSIRSGATGGAFGEFDAISPVNPAAIGGVQRTVVTVQVEPEYRTLRLGEVRERNTIQRIPLLLVVFPLPRNYAVSLSATSFLDRSYSTATIGQAVLGDETVPTIDNYSVRGAMSDLRAALGYRVNERLAFGVAGHLFMGSNDVAVSRRFEDTVRFGSLLDSSTVQFQGSAFSVGADYYVVKNVAVSASYRHGNRIESREGGQLQSRATVPARFGGGVRFEGVPGSVFALGIEQVRWSDMRQLGTSAVDVRDAVNWQAGAEVAGPRIWQSLTMVRAGYARSQLPFGVDGRAIREHRFAGGIGIPFAQDAAAVDLSIQRASRTLSGSDAKEGAWRLGLGIQIRP